MVGSAWFMVGSSLGTYQLAFLNQFWDLGYSKFWPKGIEKLPEMAHISQKSKWLVLAWFMVGSSHFEPIFIFWSSPILAHGYRKNGPNGPKLARMSKKRFDCSDLPKWLVQCGLWLDNVLGHPIWHIWTNFEIWVILNFGPGVWFDCSGWPNWLV